MSRTGQRSEVGQKIKDARGDHTQEWLAGQANISLSLLQKIEVGQKPASRPAISAIAAALGMTPEHLVGWTPADLTDDSMEDPVKRRDLLSGALAAGITGVGLSAIAHTRARLDGSLAAFTEQRPDLDHFAAAAETYARGYGGEAPSRRLAQLAADVADLRPMLEVHQPEPLRLHLCRTIAQLGGMAAVVLHDLGESAEAMAWFESAATAARASGDRRLHAWVLARQSMTPLTYARPDDAVRLAEEARALAGRTPSASGVLAAAVSARAYAMIGMRDLAFAAITDMEKMSARLDNEQSADTWFGLPEQKQHVHLSHALTLLGETGRARESQDRALALSGPNSHQTRTLLVLDRAMCTNLDGDPVEAGRAAVQALVALPPDQRTGLIDSRGLALYRAMPKDRARQQVRDLRELLAA